MLTSLFPNNLSTFFTTSNRSFQLLHVQNQRWPGSPSQSDISASKSFSSDNQPTYYFHPNKHTCYPDRWSLNLREKRSRISLNEEFHAILHQELLLLCTLKIQSFMSALPQQPIHRKTILVSIVQNYNDKSKIAALRAEMHGRYTRQKLQSPNDRNNKSITLLQANRDPKLLHIYIDTLQQVSQKKVRWQHQLHLSQVPCPFTHVPSTGSVSESFGLLHAIFIYLFCACVISVKWKLAMTIKLPATREL